MVYTCNLSMPVAKELLFPFFYDVEKWFRLNPQWELLSLESFGLSRGARFGCRVKYDRTEEEVTYAGSVEDLVENNRISIRLQAGRPRLFTITVSDAANGMSLISYEETAEEELSQEEKTELNLWLGSIGNYILIARKKTFRGRIWKRIIDRVWLKMSPQARRIVFIILVSESFAFLLFLGVILWMFFTKKA
jgi:hypothetical protein